jgi:hypothetical protein
MATIFVSPGVYTKEQDFSVFASRIGITRLGLVGKTEKGPAFEPIQTSTSELFNLRFGGTSPDLPLAYVANAFLGQSNELTVTRILGATGFINSNAWLIVADDSIEYGGTTGATGMTLTVANSAIVTGWTFTTSANTAMVNQTVSAFTVGNNVQVNFSGDAVSTTAWYNAIVAATPTFFTSNQITLVGNSSSTYISSAGTQIFNLTASEVEARGSYSGATLAVLRSKRNQISGDFYFTNENQLTIGAVTTTLGQFILSAATGPLTAVTNSGFTVSLDETQDSYITKILGKSPKIISGLPQFYVERIYPHFVREASADSTITGLKTKLVYVTGTSYTDFQDGYTNAVTPWVVSRVVGNQVSDLFRVQTISDGDASNREIKISIANLDLVNYTFDIIVRSFTDTDATASVSTLERWANLSFDPTSSTYLAKVIGTTDESYPRKSMFITLDLAENIPVKSLPAGFRGYELRSPAPLSGASAPGIYYKTTYLSGDSKFKTYLGLSELAYTALTQAQVSTFNAVKTLEADLFQYDGGVSSGKTTTKGFHMENIADPTQFVSGDKNSLTAYTNAAQTLLDRTLLKFTLVPYGGFDGWDKYKQYENTYEEFTDAYLDNINQFKLGIDTMQKPEEVDVNLFATPGIDFYNNETLVKYALEMVENRADSLYLMDSPRLTVGTDKGDPSDLVSRLQTTGIDSNYAATYWPWIQIEDNTSGLYTYQSPTLMVVRAIAFTDNVSAPWFAPAGLNRGLAGAGIVRADIKLDTNDRDTLYQGRINPIATFVQQGISIWGQKTLQNRQSALDRINVRRLLLQVRRLIAAASLTLVFEQNDQTLRDQFLAKVEPILLQIQNQRGLTAFKVVMDDSNNTADTIDRNILVGKIQLKPTRTAEFIDLTFQVLPTGARFEDF